MGDLSDLPGPGDIIDSAIEAGQSVVSAVTGGDEPEPSVITGESPATTGAAKLCEAAGGTPNAQGGCDYPEGSEDDPPDWLTKRRSECAELDKDVDDNTGECIDAKPEKKKTPTYAGGGGAPAPKKAVTATWGTGTRVAVGAAVGGVTAGAIGVGISMAMKGKQTALVGIGAGLVGALIGGGAGFLFGSGLEEP